jgi:signal transduction histidine kinase
MIADDALEQTNDPARLQRAVEQLSVWLGHAAQEGRAAVNSLRASTMETNDLAEALRRASEDCQLRKHSKVIFSVTGDNRDLHPIVRDEIYHIGYEAIRNACRHSQASRLEINLKYNHNLYICVKDNGIGIDPLIISKGKEGHFGLKGMRERAARIGAKLIINSSINAGTEVILTVSGKLVFHKPDESASEI